MRGFTLINDKGISTTASAQIQKNKVVLQVSSQDKITKVQYGWQPYTDANLVNEAGLPASTFQIPVQ